MGLPNLSYAGGSYGANPENLPTTSQNSLGNTSKQKGTLHQIRDQFYYIEIAMYNQIEGQKPLYVPFFFVDSISIHESIYNFITKGEIVLNTDFEIFTRGSQGNNAVKAPYIDRTDGRNRIHIIIRPIEVTSENDNITVVDNDKKFPKKYWELDMDFVVIDIQDLPIQNAQRKQRRYIFVEERYQLLKEKNLEWSSITIAAKKLNKKNVEIKDSEGALNPNDMLKDFLTIVSTNNNTMPKIKVGFDNNGSIDNPNIDFDKIDNANWDAGKPDNKALIIPTANSTALDDLFVILSHCTSSDGFPVILDYGRNSEQKGWQLISLSKFFEQASEQQVERLIVEDGLMPDGDNDESPPYIARADDQPGTQTKNFTSLVASRIQKYSFSPMVALDDARILNSPTVFFDEHTGAFNIIKKDNTAQNVIDKLKELATKGLYTFKNKSGTKPQIVINLNQTKKTGQMTKYEHAINGPYGLKTAPLNQMILDAIFLNQSLAFQCPGLTIRTPGKFVFVDRLGSGETNPFDDRFLGQWFVTSVSHLFTQGTYVTELVGNKIDSFSTLWPEEDSKY
jgi:hypothetical protein